MTGSGTLADPYVIYDVNDLQNMNLDLAAYYELANDIDASATSGWNGGAGFIPIGQAFPYFTGHLDGKSYKVTDLTINRAASDIQALIGNAKPASGYIVKNLTLEGGSVTGDDECGTLVAWVEATGADCIIENCHSDLAITGDHSLGGLIGRIVISGGYGITVKDCSCTGNVVSNIGTTTGYVGGLIGRSNSSVIDTCCATGSITAAATVDNVGGLVGYSDDDYFRDSYATGNITGGDDYVGGFIGRANTVKELQRCYATGNATANDDYIGGFVGRLDMDTDLTCLDCYSRGNVTGDQFVGGFVGYLTTDSIIDNCYSTGLVNGTTYFGGFCGMNTGTITNCFWDTETSETETSDGGTGKTTAQMKIKTTFMGAGWNFKTIWNILATVNDSYPAFIEVVTRIKGNPIIDQRIYQHVERMPLGIR